ncbi:MAG: universal stress protein [Candidatus Hydrothermarchaeaceae archaeon]
MKKILIAIDGISDSDNALEQGGELARNAGSKVVLLAVQRKLEDIESYLPALSYFLKKTHQEDEEEVRDKLSSLCQQLLSESKKALEKKGVSVKTVLKWGRPADEILNVADKEGVDLIALGCKGKHLSKRFLGSVSDDVVERSKVSVLVAR